MGLFSSEGICKICGARGSGKVISGGFLCNDCAKKCAAYLTGIAWGRVTLQQAKDMIELHDKNCNDYEIFSKTDGVRDIFEIDNEHRLWKLPTLPFSEALPGIFQVFPYEAITSFDLLQNGEAVTKGGLGRAIAGGLLFGGVGAIVGGVTGTKTTNQVITEYRIRIILNHPTIKERMIYVLPKSKKVKPTDSAFLQYTDDAKKILTILDSIVNENKSTPKEQPALQPSAADEIMKFKQLMDNGIITPEEFEAKKKQLLNL